MEARRFIPRPRRRSGSSDRARWWRDPHRHGPATAPLKHRRGIVCVTLGREWPASPQMCACLRVNGAIILPCQRVPVRRETGRRGWVVWAGFAQREALGWWERNGGILVDVWAERFALRSRGDSRLDWREVPHGQVVRAVIDLREDDPL